MDERLIAYVVIALLFALTICAIYLGIGFEKKKRKRQAKNRAKTAGAAEDAAITFLERCGFKLEDVQARTTWPVHVDGERVDVEIIADLIVSKKRRRYIAEVKSTTRVARIQFGPTRRQLLEYRLAFGIDSILLVDMEKLEISEIEFPEL